MKSKQHETMQRALILAIFQLGLLAGLQLGCAAQAAGQTVDEVVAKVLAARGGL
jgi:hypothetical protein